MDHGLQYLSFLEDYCKHGNRPVISLPESELPSINELFGVGLPRAYLELYMVFGRSFGFRFFPENEYDIEEYPAFLEHVSEFAEQAQYRLLPDDNIFVFAICGAAGLIWFFRLDEGDDPPVYTLWMHRPTYEKIADHYSEFVYGQHWHQHYIRKEKK